MKNFLTNYVMRHLQAAISSFGQISRTPIASFMTCLIIGIALALPTLLFVALKNFGTISNNLQETMQITAFLKTGTKESSVNQLSNQLKTNPKISDVKIISPAQGLKELQEQAGFQGALVALPNNPLPWALVIQPKSTHDLENLADTLQTNPAVESLQLDKQWVKRLAGLMSVGFRSAFALAIFLGIAVLLIINNTIRSATQQNHKEIEVIKLIGGTSAFIRRPFLYTGIIYGLLGGIIAWLLVDILLLLLKNPIADLSKLYHSNFILQGIGFRNTLILLGSSILLGLFGSYFAVTRHLKNS